MRELDTVGKILPVGRLRLLQEVSGRLTRIPQMVIVFDCFPEFIFITMFISRHQRRVEVELRPTILASIRGNFNAIKDWSSQLLVLIAADMKHNNFWGCKICGK